MDAHERRTHDPANRSTVPNGRRKGQVSITLRGPPGDPPEVRNPTECLIYHTCHTGPVRSPGAIEPLRVRIERPAQRRDVHGEDVRHHPHGVGNQGGRVCRPRCGLGRGMARRSRRAAARAGHGQGVAQPSGVLEGDWPGEGEVVARATASRAISTSPEKQCSTTAGRCGLPRRGCAASAWAHGRAPGPACPPGAPEPDATGSRPAALGVRTRRSGSSPARSPRWSAPGVFGERGDLGIRRIELTGGGEPGTSLGCSATPRPSSGAPRPRRRSSGLLGGRSRSGPPSSR